MMKAKRLVLGLEGPDLLHEERDFFSAHPPFGFILTERNLENPIQSARLVAELRRLADPAPLLFVDEEGGNVDRIGPLLGVRFPSPAETSVAGLDRVHECAYLMGRAARLLGFDVDLAPSVDLGQPGAGAVVLAGRTFGLFQEDVVAAGMIFMHGLSRAGVASCLKHFPGLGRATVDSHRELPVIEADDVDILVNDVVPFAKLAKNADGVMVGHGSYPGFGDARPASMSQTVHAILRERLGFEGVVYSDDLLMGALEGSIPDRALRAAAAGCDIVLLSKGFDAYEGCAIAVAALGEDEARDKRLAALRVRCSEAPRPHFTLDAWTELEEDAKRFLELMSQPRGTRNAGEGFDGKAEEGAE